jgi:flagellar biosynthesis protein FliQ
VFFSMVLLLPFMIHEMSEFFQRMMDTIVSLP